MRSSGKKTKATSWIVIHFGEVSDPRKRVERAEYSLVSILVIALAGALCGIEGWDDLHDFAEAKEEWLRSVTDLPDSLPSADTIRRVLGAIDADEFESALRSWVQAIAGSFEGQVVAIDGKSIRGAFEKGRRSSPLHLLHVWATEQRVLLGVKSVDGALSEAPEIPVMIKNMMIEGAIVTADAANTSSPVAQAALDAKAAYVLHLKANRSALHSQVETFFAHAQQDGFSGATYTKQADCGHGRDEFRESWTYRADTLNLKDGVWPQLNSITRIDRTRVTDAGTSKESHYFISSLGHDDNRIATFARTHWRIENDLHWRLDVAFGEDDCPVRDKNAATNLACVRRIALMLHDRYNTKTKRSLRRKINMARMSDAYLSHLFLVGCP